jgi:hypothetical protein
MSETSVIVSASLAVHLFSARPVVDHIVACLTCRKCCCRGNKQAARFIPTHTETLARA